MTEDEVAKAINDGASRLREIGEAFDVAPSVLSIDGIEITTIYPTSQPVIKGTPSWEVMLPADQYEAGKPYAFRVTEGEEIKYFRAIGERRGEMIVFDLLKELS